MGSVALIGLDAVFPNLPAWFGITAVLPLIVYHVAYLWPRAKSLRPAEVDSVYYLGFLITVAALAAAAFQVAGAGQADVTPVLKKFGAGLLATGYAVIARLHLQSVAKNDSPGSPEQVLETYLNRSGLLLDNLEVAILRIGTLAESAITETEKVANRSHDLLEKRANGTIENCESALRRTLNAVAESIQGIRALLTNTSFLAEREAFAATLRDSIEVARNLKASLEALTSSVGLGGEVFGRVHTAMDSLAGSTEEVNTHLAKLFDEEGEIAQATTQMKFASEASQRAAESAKAAAVGIADLAIKVGASGSAIEKLELTAGASANHLDSLSAACGRLRASVGQLADALNASERFSAGLDQLGQQLPELLPKIQTVGHQFDGIQSALASTASSLEADVHRSTRAVGLLAENLAAVAETIVERTRERQARL